MKKTKQIYLIAVVILIALFSFYSFAAEGETTGECGEALTWSFDESTGALTISGTGRMTSYSTATAVPWYSFRTQIKSVSAQEGVTNIGKYAFNGCSNLTQVELADTITSIGQNAFTSCSKLASVELPPSLGSIDMFAFEYCSALTEITMPDSLAMIYNYAFSGCTNLRNVYFSENSVLRQIFDFAFSGCTKLTEFNLPDSVIYLLQSSFSGCTGMKNFNISENSKLSSIYSGVFTNCKSLESIFIPKGVYSIGITNGAAVVPWAFNGCSKLKGITVDENNQNFKVIDKVLFKADETRILKACVDITQLTIPETVTTIDRGAFSYCADLSSVTFELDSYTNLVPEELFSYCTSLTEIQLPDGMNIISNKMFEGCTALKSVEIPQSVTKFCQSAFYHCVSLEKIDAPKNLATVDYDCFNSCSSLADVYYNDTAEAFEQITVNGNNNAPFTGARTHYNATIETHPWTENNTATCTQDGEIIVDCDCGYVQSRTPSTMTGHKETTQTTPATCTMNGETKIVCSVCLEEISSETLIAPGHKEIVTKQAKEPSYKVNGNTEEIICSVCKEILKASEAIPALNYKWTYDNNCHLYISGEGAINPADSYGWEAYNSEIMYVEIEEGITSISENCFNSTPYLTEIYLSSSVTEIDTNSISDCPLLSFVTFNSDAEIQNGAFENCNADLTFVLTKDLPSVEAFAKDNNIKTVKVSYDSNEKILSFNGDIAIEDYTEFAFLNNILKGYTDSEYIFFSELTFKNYNFWFDDDYMNAEITDNDLILHNVYVNLILVSGSEEKNVTFGQMVELLESGNYDAFKYHLQSDEKEEEGNLITRFFERILAFFSRILNFLTKLFKK